MGVSLSPSSRSLPSPCPDLSDASVRGHEEEEDWQAGKEGVSLKCLGEGNPPPTYNWTR